MPLRRMAGNRVPKDHQSGKAVPVMEESITLYHLEREDITIRIVARFEEDKLVIDGYDIGKTVERAWGDSDYEYVMTVPVAGLPPLYGLLNVKADDRKGLLRAIARRFHGNECWSNLEKFLAKNNIDHDSFTWA